MKYRAQRLFTLALLVLCLLLPGMAKSQGLYVKPENDLDRKVQQFLIAHKNSWRDMNIPRYDGKLLFKIIVDNNFQKAVEIGTSTGHSGIWIAWALSKTGGKLITYEINERRYREALENFRAAGLSEYVDARLGNARELVPRLKGEYDFVFSDADKNWYTNYFKALAPKLKVGGCYTAHNVSRKGNYYGTGDFLRYLESLPNFKTTIDEGGGGVSISYKTAKP
jgi:predicted O-methyltransferase YrrM